MPEQARAASGTVALQTEVEALRDECKSLERTTVAMRAAMATLVAEVDALDAADKCAESELNAAKARAPAGCACRERRGVSRAQRPAEFLDRQTGRAHATAAQGDYEKKAQDHQKMLAYELQIEECEERLECAPLSEREQLRAVLTGACPTRRCRREEFFKQLEGLEEQMKCVARQRRLLLPLTWRVLCARSSAHRELEVVLELYADPESKAARKAEGAAVEQLSLKLEQTQDKIDAVRTRCTRASPPRRCAERVQRRCVLMQAKRRKLCMQIALAEAAHGTAKPEAA